jgi:uncharacterized membrane protein
MDNCLSTTDYYIKISCCISLFIILIIVIGLASILGPAYLIYTLFNIKFKYSLIIISINYIFCIIIMFIIFYICQITHNYILFEKLYLKHYKQKNNKILNKTEDKIFYTTLDCDEDAKPLELE